MNSSTFVIKCGGSTLAELPDAFFEDMRDLQRRGVVPVIVHGGGPAINETLSKLGIESTFVNGLRRTSAEVLRVVEMVLCGQINKQIVRIIQRVGASAVGLSGIDGQLLLSEPVAGSDELGYVGKVTKVNNALIESILSQGYIPVIAPLGVDNSGQSYNVNADTVAGAVASSLGTRQLIVITDVPGIMKTEDGAKRVLPQVTITDIESMIASGDIYGGMIPKVRAAIECIQGKVQEVIIADGTTPEVLSRLVAGDRSIGTRIVR